VSQYLTQAREPGTTEAPELTGAPEEISSVEVWNELEKICRSRAMHGCNRLAQLLDFVVASTLRGEAVHLKETTIGVYVFGRSPDYDPKVDTIVRSQAWRLRSKIRKYYESEGAHDPIIINIPIGHYVPIFRRREQMEMPNGS
jgi:hypothetical protein